MRLSYNIPGCLLLLLLSANHLVAAQHSYFQLQAAAGGCVGRHDSTITYIEELYLKDCDFNDPHVLWRWDNLNRLHSKAKDSECIQAGQVPQIAGGIESLNKGTLLYSKQCRINNDRLPFQSFTEDWEFAGLQGDLYLAGRTDLCMTHFGAIPILGESEILLLPCAELGGDRGRGWTAVFEPVPSVPTPPPVATPPLCLPAKKVATLMIGLETNYVSDTFYVSNIVSGNITFEDGGFGEFLHPSGDWVTIRDGPENHNKILTGNGRRMIFMDDGSWIYAQTNGRYLRDAEGNPSGGSIGLVLETSGDKYSYLNHYAYVELFAPAPPGYANLQMFQIGGQEPDEDLVSSVEKRQGGDCPVPSAKVANIRIETTQADCGGTACRRDILGGNITFDDGGFGTIMQSPTAVDSAHPSFGTPDSRVAYRMDDGSLAYTTALGRQVYSPSDKKDVLYSATSILFETTSEKYAHLNSYQFVSSWGANERTDSYANIDLYRVG